MTDTRNLRTATPREIDTELARLDGEYRTLEHSLNASLSFLHTLDGQRMAYVTRTVREWPKTDQETIESLKAKLAADRMAHETARTREYLGYITDGEDALRANRALCAPYDAEYDARPWQRFFQVEAGHIHSGRWCKGGSIRETTRRGWKPELSDKDEAAAVALLGPLLCTKCFPSAPVEWSKGPEKQLRPGYCTGQGKGGRNLQMRYASPRGECPECGATVGVTSTGKVRPHKIKK